MILLKDVSYAWEDGRTALKNINLEIKKGEFVLISGKSGSGKSTLGSVMNGLIPHYYKGKMQGEVFVSGKDISKLLLHEVGHIVGTVFQDPRSQFFTTTTDEEIAFGLQTICKSRDEIKQRVEEVYAELDTPELKGKSVFELSSCTLSEYLSQSRFKMRLQRSERDKTGKAEITRDRANLTETILRVCDSNNEKNGQNFISVFEVVENKRIIG